MSDVQELQRRHRLSYHVPYALEAERAVGLAGKRVLEVGGSLPDAFVRGELGAVQWTAIEETGYWHEALAPGLEHGTPPREQRRTPVADAIAADLGSYAVLEGRVEHLPDTLAERFDVVFSIAAFEHIDRLPLALARMHRALVPGGQLFTMFSPLWSSWNGHHLPRIKDLAGQEWTFSQSPIPPFGHLLMRPPELHRHLLQQTDPVTAADMIYFVYHSNQINRLFTEDYAAYFEASPFLVQRLEATFNAVVPPDLQRRLERLHPGRRHFANNGLIVVLTKPAG